MDVSPEKSSKPSAALSVDSNTSLSVWSNLYLVSLVDEFLCGGARHQLRLQWVGDRCPSRHLFEIGCHVLLLGERLKANLVCALHHGYM